MSEEEEEEEEEEGGRICMPLASSKLLANFSQ